MDGMNTSKPSPKPDRTEAAFREVERWKAEGKRGKITLHFDGSGMVKQVEASIFI